MKNSFKKNKKYASKGSGWSTPKNPLLPILARDYARRHRCGPGAPERLPWRIRDGGGSGRGRSFLEPKQPSLPGGGGLEDGYGRFSNSRLWPTLRQKPRPIPSPHAEEHKNACLVPPCTSFNRGAAGQCLGLDCTVKAVAPRHRNLQVRGRAPDEHPFPVLTGQVSSLPSY